MVQNGKVKQRKGGKEIKEEEKKAATRSYIFIWTRRHTEKQSND